MVRSYGGRLLRGRTSPSFRFRRGPVKRKATKSMYGKRKKLKSNRSRKSFKLKPKKLINKYGALQSISSHNNANSISLKQIVLGKGSLPSKYKFKWQCMKQRVQDWPAGEQNVMLAPSFNGTRSQLLGLTSNNRFADSQWEVNPFLLNPYVNTLEPSTLYPGPFTFPVANDKLYYHGFEQHLSILNMESVACNIQVIWCLCTQNSGRTPIDKWNECAQIEERLTQSGVTTVVNTTFATALGGFNSSLRFGTHMKEYRTWSKYWKIMDTVSYMLQPGDQVNLNRSIKYNKFFTKQWVELQIGQFIAGYTIIPVIIARGATVGVYTAPDPLPDPAPPVIATEVTYGSTKIGIIENNEHHFGGVPVGSNLETSRVYQGIVDIGDSRTTFRHIDVRDEPDDVENI